MNAPTVVLVVALNCQIGFATDRPPMSMTPPPDNIPPTDPKDPKDPTDPSEAKAALRKSVALARADAAVKWPDAADMLAGQIDTIIGHFGTGIYAAYLPIRSELSPLPLVSALANAGIVTAMPITPEPGFGLDFHRYAPGDPLDDGPYKTLQPRKSAPLVTPDVILAPLLAFDDCCWRLGYGGGFYDRTIAGLRDNGHAVTIIGLAYDEQQVDSVPVGPYDMALDGVLTPSGLRRAKSSRAEGKV